MADHPEQEIIAGCLQQQRYWQEQLHRRYYGMVLKLCARYAPNMEDAEQLVQDSFLRIFSKINTYKNAGSFEGWIKRIVVNICLDYLKSKAGKIAMRIQMNITEVEEVYSTGVQDALQQMAFKDLLKLIQALPHMTRMAFNLFVFDGYNHRQIAELLGITESTSSWHVYHARKVLRDKIESLHLKHHRYAGK